MANIIDLHGHLASRDTANSYDELLRIPSLSFGVYILTAGAVDNQTPHGEDEIYVVSSGQAQFEASGESQPVGPGSIILVERDVDHRFHSITEDLTLLVFFAPAET